MWGFSAKQICVWHIECVSRRLGRDSTQNMSKEDHLCEMIVPSNKEKQFGIGKLKLDRHC